MPDDDSTVPQSGAYATPDGGGDDDVWSGDEDTQTDSFSASQDASGGQVVNYYFPVEVVVAGGLTVQDRTSIQASIFESLQDAINRRLA